MFRRTTALFTAIILLLVILAACGGSAEPEPTALPPTATSAVVEAAPPASDESTRAEATGVQTFVIVPEESSAAYIVSEEFFEGALAKLGINAGKAQVIGRTQAIEGQLQLDLSDPAALLGDNRFMVNMATLETDQSRRDEWIRDNGPNFNRFPEAIFIATALAGLPDSITPGAEIAFQMSGDLTVHEVTQPVTFDVVATLNGDTLTGTATAADLLMSNFGIEPPSFLNTLTVADPFAIEVEITARAE